MSDFTVKLLPNAEALIVGHLSSLIGRAADVAADVLDENLAVHFTSGVEWKNLPRRSSSENEFPQEQSGTLRGSIRFFPFSRARWHVGFTGLNMPYLLRLEFDSPEMGGRSPLGNTMMDKVTHEQMHASINQGIKL